MLVDRDLGRRPRRRHQDVLANRAGADERGELRDAILRNLRRDRVDVFVLIRQGSADRSGRHVRADFGPSAIHHGGHREDAGATRSGRSPSFVVSAIDQGERVEHAF